MKIIEFWFSSGSKCACLCVSRNAELAKLNDIKFEWHPYDAIKWLHGTHI